jgi:hypothetical protein
MLLQTGETRATQNVNNFRAAQVILYRFLNDEWQMAEMYFTLHFSTFNHLPKHHSML